jgi:gamma-glutamyltranspeptidase/glutathione hydrolase
MAADEATATAKTVRGGGFWRPHNSGWWGTKRRRGDVTARTAPLALEVVGASLVAVVLAVGGIASAAAPAAFSQKAVVAAATPEAADAAITVMEAGGNAVDAAVAAAFALMVTDPAMCSLGGRSQVLMRLADGTLVGIDGATQVPRGIGGPARSGRGYKTCPVPGSPAALDETWRRFGHLPLREVLEPAIKLARDGFVATRDLRERVEKAQASPTRDWGSATRGFGPDNADPSVDGRLVQPALARALEVIATNGAGDFYRGTIAAAIVRDMAAHGGLVTADDLAQYRPMAGVVLKGSYRGLQIIGRGDQCDGASVIEGLRLLERYPISTFDRFGFESLHLIAQVIYLAVADEFLPDWLQLSRELSLRRSREIDLSRIMPVSTKAERSPTDGETNHVSVVDAEGNAVAITQSIGPLFGSKVANPEFGFFYGYSYAMNEAPVPLQREKTSQSPTIVLADGKPYIVLGSAGSSRIPGSLIQTIVNVVDFGMTLKEAIDAPRIFLHGSELRIEAVGASASAVKAFESLGYRVKSYEQLDGWFGRVHGALVDRKSGTLSAVSDPRDAGGAAGL